MLINRFSNKKTTLIKKMFSHVSAAVFVSPLIVFAVPVLPRFCVSSYGLGGKDWSRWTGVASRQTRQEVYALQISFAWAQIHLLSITT